MSYHLYDNKQIIRAFGPDCINFLQGQLTNDITLLNSNNTIQLNALCNQKGRVIALLFIGYVAENELLLALPNNLVNRMLETLKKYSLFSKISFEVCTDYQLVYSSNKNEQGFLLQHGIINMTKHHIKSTINLYSVKKDNIFQKLPIINIDNTEIFLPAELNLDQFNAVNYQKGCFMGQEIIARMKYRGNLKKELLSIETKSRILSTNKLQDIEGKKIADIVNYIIIKNHSYILAVFNQKIDNKLILLHGNMSAKVIA